MGTEAGNVGSRGNADAERVLTRIRQKLDGYEDGELLSISGQVSSRTPSNADPPATNDRCTRRRGRDCVHERRSTRDSNHHTRSGRHRARARSQQQ